MTRYAVFKLPRTGSSTLAEVLNATDGVICHQEALNDWDPATSSQEFVDALMSRPEPEVRGFTINPQKYRIDHSFYVSDQPMLVFRLLRKGYLEQAVSVVVSRLANAHPSNRASGTANAVLDYVEANKILPADEFRDHFTKTVKQSTLLAKTADEFATAHGVNVVDLTYEGLFYGEDFARVSDFLGVQLNLASATPEKKVLPRPEDWIENIDELREIAAEETAQLASGL